MSTTLDCTALVNELETMAATIVGMYSPYEWCEMADARLLKRGIQANARPINSKAACPVATAALDQLVARGTITFAQGGPAGQYGWPL